MISSSWQLWAKAVTIKPLLSAHGVRSRLKSPGSRFVPVRMQIKVTLSEVGFPVGSEGEESACRAGHPGSIPGSGRFPGEGKGNPLQYSCLENSVDSGDWWATVHGVAGSDMTKQLTDFRFNMFSWNKPPSLLSLEYTATGKMMLFSSIECLQEFCAFPETSQRPSYQSTPGRNLKGHFPAGLTG